MEDFMEEALAPDPGQLQEAQRDLQFAIHSKFLIDSQRTELIGKLMEILKSLSLLDPIVLVHLSRVHKTKVPRGSTEEISMSEVENWGHVSSPW